MPLVSLINEIKTLSNGNFLDRVLDSSPDSSAGSSPDSSPGSNPDSNNSISPIMTNLYRLPVKHGTGNPGMEWNGEWNGECENPEL